MWLSFRVFGGSYIWNEPPSARLCFQSSGSVLLQDCIKYLVEFSAYPTALRSSFLSCYITWVIPSRNLYFSLPWYISLYWSECFMYRKTLLPKKKKKSKRKKIYPIDSGRLRLRKLRLKPVLRCARMPG